MTTIETISVVINGHEIKAQPGAMVLEAAIEAGIYIPYLCYHPGMKPFAACRLCLVQEEVEVEVDRGGEIVRQKQLRPAMASCTTPIRDGMVIKTATATVRDMQTGVMEMLISEHPHGCLTCHRVELCGPQDICQRHVSVNDRCVTCPKNERCELKDSVRYLGMEMNSPLSYKVRGSNKELADPFYDRDYDLCIVCGRCVRACEELRGDNAITFLERAGQSLVGTSRGQSLLQSGCEFCGACIDVCPVGALVERDHKWEKAQRVERTTCPNCPVGCQLNLEVNGREKVVRAVPELNAPANRGQACFKGKFGLEFVNHRERLKYPLIRRNGKFEEATWDDALRFVGESLKKFKGSEFAALASSRSTNESCYVLQKFTRTVMETNNVDSDSNNFPELRESLATQLGYPASTNDIWELEGAGCILAVNTNVTEDQNVVAVPVKRAVRSGNTKLVVIDTREVELTHYADIWLRPMPGTTLTLLGGMLKYIVDEALVDSAFIHEQCKGLDELLKSLGSFDLDSVEQTTRVPKDQIWKAATLYADSGPGAILYAMDNVAQEQQTLHARALVNLALVTGNIGKPSTGLYALSTGANSQGAADVGCVPNFLPGYQRIDESPGQHAIQEVWGRRVPRDTGFSVRDIEERISDSSVKAMLILGDPTGYDRDNLGNGFSTLDRLEFLVVHDTFLGPVAQMADVVFPATTFAEEDGTFTNLARRIQLVKKVITPKNFDTQSASQFICRLAKAMGGSGFDFESPAEIFSEISSLVKFYQGVSHSRLANDALVTLRPDPAYPQPTQLLYSDRVAQGIQWPCWDIEGPGTSILYTEGFGPGKAYLLPIDPASEHLEISKDYPFIFVPGRVLAHWDREVEVIQVDGMNHIQKEELIEIHSQDAVELGVQQGDSMEVIGNGWHMLGAVYITDTTHPGTVSVTTLFGELATHLQLSKNPDPMSKVSGLKISQVRLQRLA
ncbi:MAG: hypothetical protein BZY82_07065 [SAR202 cluster bacterium Io17-Chloro-G3]|nr:MAG: hypothetical protein BZY82_07065 [SAR202 cluster bacterium Io17-Chloro-G3]